MKYSETGKFTDEQMKVINELMYSIWKLKREGCCLTVNTKGKIVAYKDTDMYHRSDLCSPNTDVIYPIKGICIADLDKCLIETPCFKKGYITEE